MSGDKEASYDVKDESRFISNYRSNVRSDLIEITEDKLENILIKHLSRIGARKAWIAPLGIFISVILAITSATFTDKFGISQSTWEALFYLSGIGSFIWLFISIISVVINWKKSSTDYLIKLIKDSLSAKNEG